MSRLTLRLAITLQAAISAGDGLAMIALANRVYQSSHAPWAVAAMFLAGMPGTAAPSPSRCGNGARQRPAPASDG